MIFFSRNLKKKLEYRLCLVRALHTHITITDVGMQNKENTALYVVHILMKFTCSTWRYLNKTHTHTLFWMKNRQKRKKL